MNLITDSNATSETDHAIPSDYSWISYVSPTAAETANYNYYTQERVYCSQIWKNVNHRYILICK